MNKKFCILGLMSIFLSSSSLAQTTNTTFTVGIKIVEQCKIDSNNPSHEKVSVNCGVHQVPYKISEDNTKYPYNEKEIKDSITQQKIKKIEF